MSSPRTTVPVTTGADEGGGAAEPAGARSPDGHRVTRPSRRRTVIVVAGLLGLLFTAMVLAVALGSVTVPPGSVLGVVGYRLTGMGDPTGWTLIQDNIVWDLRVPRVLLAALVGAGFSVVGVAAQALVRNPLADPYILGITPGASAGAVAVLVLWGPTLGSVSPGLAAFIGAGATFVAVFLLAGRTGVLSPSRLILTGVILGYALLGATQFLITLADEPGKTQSALFWLFGSLAGAHWTNLGLPAAVLVCGTALLALRGRALNALLIGDETAASLGIRPDRIRRELFAVIALLTGVMVSMAGGISFVGLIVPHTMRLIVGSEHRRLLPLTALAGAVFLVVVDLLCRMVLSPQELPIGVMTSIIGAPVFLTLMARRRLSESGL